MDEITREILSAIFISATIMLFVGFLLFLQEKEINLWQYYHNINHEVVSVDSTRFPLQDIPRIRFQTFLDWYYLNPEKWKTCNWFACKVGERIGEFYPIVIYPYRDWIRYLSWRRKTEKHKTEQKCHEAQNKALKSLLGSIQRDIDKMKLQSQKELEEAKQRMTEIPAVSRFGMTVN